MIKLLAIIFFTAALAACSSMHDSRSTMGNKADIQHSTDSAAAKTGNAAAASPAGGSGGAGAAGGGAGGAAGGAGAR